MKLNNIKPCIEYINYVQDGLYITIRQTRRTMEALNNILMDGTAHSDVAFEGNMEAVKHRVISARESILKLIAESHALLGTINNIVGELPTEASAEPYVVADLPIDITDGKQEVTA